MTPQLLIFTLAALAFVISAIGLVAIRKLSYSNAAFEAGLWIGGAVSLAVAIYFAP